MNDDSILIDDLCHLPNVFLFDGHYVVCDPKCHTGHLDECLDHGEERTGHCIERTEYCIASANYQAWICKLQLCFGWNS